MRTQLVTEQLRGAGNMNADGAALNSFDSVPSLGVTAVGVSSASITRLSVAAIRERCASCSGGRDLRRFVSS